MRLMLVTCGIVYIAVAYSATAAQGQSTTTLALLQGGEPPGSTMTLEQLQQKAKSPAAKADDEIHAVEAAGEPNPAMKHRLYPAKWELQPDSALLHFNRAMIAFLRLPDDFVQKIHSEEWIWGTGDGSKPSPEELGKVIGSLSFIYQEVHELAMSDDFDWDHRLRSLTGPDVYMYQLNDVQEIRSLARLLQLRIRYQLMQRNFDGAIGSISDGIRLSEFVGQGETLIQKLVGIAIQAMMRQCMVNAISTPGCPNLYWAIASIPRPLNNVSESVLWELNNVTQVLPALAEAETAEWNKDEAAKKWKQTVNQLLQLSSTPQDTASRTVIAIAGMNQGDTAKENLIANGLPKERVDAMPDLQAVLASAAQKLRQIGDGLGKAHLLPTIAARKLAKIQHDDFKNFIRKNRASSLAGVISALLYPAVRQAAEAEVRIEMSYHRLMTLEAIRMYAADNGKLPNSLDDLNPAPAFPDPYTGDHFSYSVEEYKKGPTVTLKAAGPASYRPLQVLKVQFTTLAK